MASLMKNKGKIISLDIHEWKLKELRTRATRSGLDTIEVKVTVFPNATLQFEPQFPKDSVAYDTIKIDSILRARLVGFPKVNPAIKRGIPVKTQFILPSVRVRVTVTSPPKPLAVPVKSPVAPAPVVEAGLLPQP
jgi:hypothetical protein